jgi:hypothetical protein
MLTFVNKIRYMPLFILYVVICIKRSVIEVFDRKVQVPVPSIDVFLVRECCVLNFVCILICTFSIDGSGFIGVR